MPMHAPALEAWECGLSWKRGPWRCSYVKGLQVILGYLGGPYMQWVVSWKRHSGRRGQGHVKTGREWSDTAASPGTPRVARGWGCSKEGSLLEPSEGSWASRPLDFGLLASRAVTITFCCELPCLWAQDTSTAGKLGSDRAEGREGCLGGGRGMLGA